jgi:hypothetical protein
LSELDPDFGAKPVPDPEFDPETFKAAVRDVLFETILFNRSPKDEAKAALEVAKLERSNTPVGTDNAGFIAFTSFDFTFTSSFGLLWAKDASGG